MRRFGLFIALLLTVIVTSATVQSSSPQAVPMSQPEAAPASVLAAGPFAAQGKLTFLRVHNVGSGYGPGSDFLDVEVVTKLDSTGTGKSYGFQLRDDANRAARQGMLDLLRDAYNNNWTVILDYTLVDNTKNNGTIIRVALIK